MLIMELHLQILLSKAELSEQCYSYYIKKKRL